MGGDVGVLGFLNSSRLSSPGLWLGKPRWPVLFPATNMSEYTHTQCLGGRGKQGGLVEMIEFISLHQDQGSPVAKGMSTHTKKLILRARTKYFLHTRLQAGYTFTQCERSN